MIVPRRRASSCRWDRYRRPPPSRRRADSPGCSTGTGCRRPRTAGRSASSSAVCARLLTSAGSCRTADSLVWRARQPGASAPIPKHRSRFEAQSEVDIVRRRCSSSLSSGENRHSAGSVCSGHGICNAMFQSISSYDRRYGWGDVVGLGVIAFRRIRRWQFVIGVDGLRRRTSIPAQMQIPCAVDAFHLCELDAARCRRSGSLPFTGACDPPEYNRLARAVVEAAVAFCWFPADYQVVVVIQQIAVRTLAVGTAGRTRARRAGTRT